MFLGLVLETPKRPLPVLKERCSLAETTVCWSSTNMPGSYTHSTHRLTQTINNLAPCLHFLKDDEEVSSDRTCNDMS